MEKRNIKVTLEQAIEWYNSDNATLRTLALSAYSKDELEGIESIERQMKCQTMIGHFNVIEKDYKKFQTLTLLNTIAKYFNGNCWEKITCNTGYFIAKTRLGSDRGVRVQGVDIPSNISVEEHNTVRYPGIVYFKSQKDAIRAVEILGERVNDLF